MRVVWVSFTPLRKTPAGLASDLASIRYRLLVPAQALPESRVTQISHGANRRTLLERFAGADAAVFGKIFEPTLAPVALELAAALRAKGVKVIVDFCDDHFDHPQLGPVYRALANVADAIVASTPGLADVIREQTSRKPSVVDDPVEGVRAEPAATPGRPVRLLWFGHPSNLDTLRFGLPQLDAREVDFALTVMTAAGSGAESSGYRFRPWSTAGLFDELRQCDAVIIPSNPYDPRKAVKSANRFTEALWAGRFVIAHPLPSYEPLAPYGWVGEDLGEGLAWLLDHRDEAPARIRAGQEWVAANASREAVAAAWKAAIGGVL
jgi:hypothetical protein